MIARSASADLRGLADQILDNANREADTIRWQADVAAKEELLKRREGLDAEIDLLRRDLRDQERRIEKRSDLIDQKLELINDEGARLRGRPALPQPSQQEELKGRKAEIKKTLADQLDSLQRISLLSVADARDLLLKRVEDELGHEVGNADPEAPDHDA